MPGGAGKNDGDGFLLDRRHPRSHRHAILEAGGRCAWLYLTVPEALRIERSTFVFSTGPLVTLDESMETARSGEAPPLAVDYASPDSVLAAARAEHFAFRWADDGQSVAVLHQGDPIAMIIAGVDRGFSRALGKSGLYGYPWNSDVYDDTFGP